MNPELIENSVTAPHEHPAVPVVAARFDIPVGGRFIRFLAEHLHAICAATASAHRKRLATVNVTKSSVPVRGDDAESHQRIRMLRDDVETRFDRALKNIDRLDHMV